MKGILILITVFSFTSVNAQVYSGKGDKKVHIGATVQNNATGVNAGYYYGVGENFSIGISSGYTLSNPESIHAEFDDRIDLKLKFNAHIGSIINIDDNFDAYPGVNIGLKNFGAHIGFRYFFSDGLGLYTEFLAPISKYRTSVLSKADKVHNQFSVNLGAAFNF